MAKNVLPNFSNISGDRNTKFTAGIKLLMGYRKIEKLGEGVPPFLGKLAANFKIQTRISQPPRGF